MKLLLIAILTCSSLLAKDTGEISGQLKAMYLIDDKTNTFTPRNGSAFLGKLKYVSPQLLDTLRLGSALYVNGDTGLTDWEDTSKKKAMGMFVSEEGKAKFFLGEAYLEYKTKRVFAKVGRQIFNSPLTKIHWSFMPNFYEAGYLSLKLIPKLAINILHVNRMSFGSREAADFGLIGEKTGTAGAVRPMQEQSPNGIERANFMNLGLAAGVADTKGMSALNLDYKINENM